MSGAQSYPHTAGYKGDKATGRDAADYVNLTLGARQAAVLGAVQPYGSAGCIPEQVAKHLLLPVHTIRPRFSELEKLGRLFPVGRRMGHLGKHVTAYSVVRPPDVPDNSEPDLFAGLDRAA